MFTEEAATKLIGRAVSARYSSQMGGEVTRRIETIDGVVDASFSLQDIAPSELKQRSVVRFRRSEREAAGWRTVLIARVPGPSRLRFATQWAAEVRSSLGEPEGADLYLIVISRRLSEKDIAIYEAEESFCRRFLIEDNGDFDSLIDRTFLAGRYEVNEVDRLSNPINAALEMTSHELGISQADLDELARSFKESESGADAARKLMYGADESDI